MTKIEKDSSQSKENHPNEPLRGWPGYRTRGERSGLDPVDAYAEQGHMQGTLLRMLFTGRLPLTNPAFLLIAVFLGVIGLLPLALILIIVVTESRQDDALSMLLLTSPFWMMGIFLLFNVARNLSRLVMEQDSRTRRISRLVLIVLAAVLVVGFVSVMPGVVRQVRLAREIAASAPYGLEISTNATTYAPGDAVIVRLRNVLKSETIHVYGRMDCGTENFPTQVERFEDGVWKPDRQMVGQRLEVFVMCPSEVSWPSKTGRLWGAYVQHTLWPGQSVELTLDSWSQIHRFGESRYRLVYFIHRGKTPVYSNEFVIQ